MFRRLSLVGGVLFLLGSMVVAQVVPLHTVQGLVDKADKDTITVKPRGAGGKFEKTMELKLVGTSKVTTLVPLKKDGKVVYTRRETQARDLKANQPITAIYAKAKGGGNILLTGVVQAAP
jgi:hypothetical protein